MAQNRIIAGMHDGAVMIKLFDCYFYTDGEMKNPQKWIESEEPPLIERLYDLEEYACIEVRSPKPLEFDLNWRGEEDEPPPEYHTTLYFPNGVIVPYKDVIEQSSDEVQAERLREIAAQGQAYNYFFADGDEDAEPEESHFIMTTDGIIHAFCDNRIVLVPINDLVDGLVKKPNSKGDLWCKLSRQQHALGLH